MPYVLEESGVLQSLTDRLRIVVGKRRAELEASGMRDEGSAGPGGRWDVHAFQPHRRTLIDLQRELQCWSLTGLDRRLSNPDAGKRMAGGLVPTEHRVDVCFQLRRIERRAHFCFHQATELRCRNRLCALQADRADGDLWSLLYEDVNVWRRVRRMRHDRVDASLIVAALLNMRERLPHDGMQAVDRPGRCIPCYSLPLHDQPPCRRRRRINDGRRLGGGRSAPNHAPCDQHNPQRPSNTAPAGWYMRRVRTRPAHAPIGPTM